MHTTVAVLCTSLLCISLPRMQAAPPCDYGNYYCLYPTESLTSSAKDGCLCCPTGPETNSHCTTAPSRCSTSLYQCSDQKSLNDDGDSCQCCHVNEPASCVPAESKCPSAIDRRCVACVHGKCSSCTPGYVTVDGGLCTSCVVPNCKTCAKDDPYTCAACENKFALTEQKSCDPDDHVLGMQSSLVVAATVVALMLSA